MCGINGIYHLREETADSSMIALMNKAILHRGPDAQDIFSEKNLALGHVRLSIIDLSDAGIQPMQSHDGNLVMVFNGEIYNYKSLKAQLDYPFKTQTDSEVLLAAYLKWGKQMVHKLEGMFAFAIFDRSNKELFLCRDRLGIKPLYYIHNKESFVFSSEIRGLLASGAIEPKLNKQLLPEYFTMGSISGENTLLEGVKLLSPGTWIHVSSKEVNFEKYWDAKDSISQKNEELSYDKAKIEVKNSFLEAVEKRLVADVPFGAFLSGGIDSTAVVAAMAKSSTTQVCTFNVNFDESEFSEAKYAKWVANKFGTNHTEIRLKPSIFLEEIEEIIASYDHPGLDGANTYIVSQATKKAGITMALSGLGGDEVFGGYPVFKQLQPTFSKIKRIPFPANKLAASMLKFKSGVRSKKMVDLLSVSDINESDVYSTFRSNLSKKDCQQLIGSIYQGVDPLFFKSTIPFISSLSLAEFYHYMQPVLLRDADQMSMAHALEVRVPFLDHKLVELVLSLPDAYKTKTAVQKSLLVESLGEEFLPKEIVERKKMGFVLPWESWLKKELSYLVTNAIEKSGNMQLFDKKPWLLAYADFKSGKGNYNWNIFWGLVTLVSWMERNEVEV